MVMEAERFGARIALIIVHSFSEKAASYDDHSEFLALFGVKAAQNRLVFLTEVKGVSI